MSDNIDGIVSEGTSSTVSGNTVCTNDAGILSDGDSSTISDNTASNNLGGIVSVGSSSSISGNRITGNIDIGLYLDSCSDGTVFNNYFANTNNVDGDSTAISSHTWNQAPTPGTNVVGGPNIAGNYWSNPTGIGWSDTHATDSRRYTDEPYEVITGVYDNAPLVRTPTPGPDNGSSDRYFSSPPDTGNSSPQIRFVIVSASLATGAAPGTATILTLTLENKGTNSLSPQARIVLTPVNDLAKAIGEQPGVYADGKYTLTFPLQIPTEPGTYSYIFSPVLITKDPVTGEDIRIPAGDPVQFTVTVGEDGTVSVKSP